MRQNLRCVDFLFHNKSKGVHSGSVGLPPPVWAVSQGNIRTKKDAKSTVPVADDTKDVSIFFTCMHFPKILPTKYPSMSVCRFKTSFPCYLVGISKKLRRKLNQQIPYQPLSSTQINRLSHGELLRSHRTNLNRC